MVTLRDAVERDATALARLDAVTWSPAVTPAPAGRSTAARWVETIAADDVIVAGVDEGADVGAIIGSIVIGQTIPLPTHAHVLEIKGLAVAPDRQGQGVGRMLIEAACERAQRRGARKLSLRVMATNPKARRLYAALGFRIEGVLRGEFLIDAAPVDDVLMARDLASAPPPKNGCG